MEKELLYHFLECCHKIYSAAFRIYEDGKLIKKFETANISEEAQKIIDEEFILKAVANNKTPVFDYGTSVMKAGKLNVGDTGLLIVVGPVRTNIINDAVLRKFYYSLKDNRHIDEIYNYVKIMPIINIRRFVNLVDMVNCFVNGNVEDYTNYVDTSTTLKINLEQDILEYRENREYDEETGKQIYAGEQRTLFFIKNGMVEQVKNLFENASFREAYRQSSKVESLRQMKNSTIVGIGLMTRAAMEAGIEPGIAYYICDLYTELVELARNFNEVNKIKNNAIMSFTQKVNDSQVNKTDNPVIARAIKYIDKNIYKKITCEEISDEININRSYFSTSFKKIMGMAVMDYINNQKVIQAQYLLRFTDKSLVDISCQLAFSSQAYFHRIFKKVTGVTPLEYRQSFAENK